MINLKEIFTTDVVNHYKNNKGLITSELLETLRSYGNEGKQLALDILDTEKSEDNYYLDAYGEKISYEGDRNLKKAYTDMKLSPIHIEELRKCKEDLYYFKDNYVKIRTKEGVNFPETRSYQIEFLDSILNEESEGTVSLQGRQAGKSVTTAIYLLWKFIFNENINIGICANKGSLAREFLNNVKMIFGFLPMWMKVGIVEWNKGSISSESNTRILTDVPSQNSFRGFSINILVIDEVAFIKSTIWNEFADSIFPSQSSLSWKKNILISTPNGLNHWKAICDKAKSGESGYLFHFVDWRDVPRFDNKGNKLSPEEFRERTIRKYGEVFFQQNYACCWIGSSETLVDAEALESFKSKEPVLTWDSKLKIYQEPIPKHKYIMAVDPSKCYGDAFAVHIIDITAKPFIQAASAQLFNENFQRMPIFLDEWGRRYNNAFMIIENNEGAGTFVAVMLKNDYEYPNLFYDKTYNKMTPLGKMNKEPGFRTTTKSRNLILDTLKLFLDNKLLLLNDKATIEEFYTFIAINGKYQAEDGYHDDMVMALAVAFAPFCNSRNFDDMSKIIDTLYDDTAVAGTLIGDHLAIGNFDDYCDSSVDPFNGMKGFGEEFTMYDSKLFGKF